jgi:hypothetical protein
VSTNDSNVPRKPVVRWTLWDLNTVAGESSSPRSHPASGDGHCPGILDNDRIGGECGDISNVV